MTEKHVLIGRKHDMLGNQTFEVLQLLKRTVYMIPFTYFTYSSLSRHLNHLISEIHGQRKFAVSAVFVYRKHINKFKSFPTLVRTFGYRAQNFKCLVTKHMSCLRPVRTCFSVTCLRLDENDGISSFFSERRQ